MLEDLKETECSCDKCVDMCASRPCWPTPVESKKIIEAGYGDRLMEDHWVNTAGRDTKIISPAIKGCERKRAPFWPHGACTFLINDLCELHDKGLKPVEGRLADCELDREEVNVHEEVAKTWETLEGCELSSQWFEGIIE